jgi:hypothetical protein
MSYLLFASQSLLTLPWVVLFALSNRLRVVASLGFLMTWLGIGYYMFNLF